MFNDIAYLGTKQIDVDEYGNQAEVFEWVPVYVKRSSLRQSEFYQAAMAGLKPTMVLTMAYMDEYDGQEVVKYNDKLYDITRTYANRGHLELTLTRKAGRI